MEMVKFQTSKIPDSFNKPLILQEKHYRRFLLDSALRKDKLANVNEIADTRQEY